MLTGRTCGLLLLAAILGCSSPTAPNPDGAWGGPEASLVLSPAGGRLAYLCGSGTMASNWVLSPDGRLTGSGQHYFGGGPVPPGGPVPHPARYSGRLDGDTLDLTVTLTDLGQTLGPFRLLRGGPAVHEICL
jgi:hypothetical protein